MSGINEARRTSFGSVAEQYDTARPTYPAALVDDVLAFAAAGSGARALEVGAGTGKATALFAARGLVVDAVEPSAEMAAVGARNVPAARFDVARLEDARLEAHAYRLAFSAQAWHWVTPLDGERIVADALVPGGAIACFWNYPEWGRSPLRDALDAAYELVDEWKGGPGPNNPRADLGSDPRAASGPWYERIDATPGLGDAEVRRYEWSQRYTTAEYLALIGTHSDHILLSAADRDRLFAGVAAAIDGVGGAFDLPYATRLALARASG